jgi:hypothetical protein
MNRFGSGFFLFSLLLFVMMWFFVCADKCMVLEGDAAYRCWEALFEFEDIKVPTLLCQMLDLCSDMVHGSPLILAMGPVEGFFFQPNPSASLEFFCIPEEIPQSLLVGSDTGGCVISRCSCIDFFSAFPLWVPDLLNEVCCMFQETYQVECDIATGEERENACRPLERFENLVRQSGQYPKP